MTGGVTLALRRARRSQDRKARAFVESLCWVHVGRGEAYQTNIRPGQYAAYAAAIGFVTRIEDPEGNRLWPPALKVVA
jgi:hypothetical protein